jgi:hypothetical protein
MTSLIAVAVPVVTAVFLILTFFTGKYRGVNWSDDLTYKE